jgi:hypothetical protein
MSLDSNWTGHDKLGPEFTNTSTTRCQIQTQQAAIQFEKQRTTLLLLGSSSANSQESRRREANVSFALGNKSKTVVLLFFVLGGKKEGMFGMRKRAWCNSMSWWLHRTHAWWSALLEQARHFGMRAGGLASTWFIRLFSELKLAVVCCSSRLGILAWGQAGSPFFSCFVF